MSAKHKKSGIHLLPNQRLWKERSAADGKSVEEKRIYAPSFFKITNGGKDITMITGIPGNLDDQWGELSDEQYAEMSDAFRDFFS